MSRYVVKEMYLEISKRVIIQTEKVFRKNLLHSPITRARQDTRKSL
jgi:hypothetical protein